MIFANPLFDGKTKLQYNYNKPMLHKKPKTISEYIASAPKTAQKKLREMRACIKKAAPDAKEDIRWSMPAFSYRRILVMFGGFKHHIGFYPTARAVSAFKKKLSKFKTARGSIQFPLNKPLPLSLIRKITKFRIQESKKEDRKWRS